MGVLHRESFLPQLRLPSSTALHARRFPALALMEKCCQWQLCTFSEQNHALFTAQSWRLAQSALNTSPSPPNSSSGEALPEARREGEDPEEGRGWGQDTSTSVPSAASLIKPIQGSLFELRLANVSARYSSCAPAERASLQVTKSATKSSTSSQQRSPRPILPQTLTGGTPTTTPPHRVVKG